MDCLVAYPHAAHDLMRPPSETNVGGSVSLKYARVAVMGGNQGFRLITSLAEIESDILFADWLWFDKAFMDHQDMDSDERVAMFLDTDVRFRGISGTELSVMTWPDDRRRKLVENVDCITDVNDYQREMYTYCGIQNSKRLCDPVPETLFYPAQKTRRLICNGQISNFKRSYLVYELFKALRDTDIETCYIGSSTTWGRTIDKEAIELEAEIKDVADVFLGNCAQIDVAYWLNSSTFYAHVGWQDVGSIAQREAAMAGVITFALTHPSMKGVPAYRYETIQALATAVVNYPMEKFAKDSERAREFAMECNSYKAWRQQMLAIVYPPRPDECLRGA